MAHYALMIFNPMHVQKIKIFKQLFLSRNLSCGHMRHLICVQNSKHRNTDPNVINSDKFLLLY